MSVMMDQSMLQQLEKRLQALESNHASGDAVPMEDVRQLFQAIRDLFEGNFNAKDVELYGELGELAQYINNARKELRDFNPRGLTDKELPEASDQLDAIVHQTEAATGSIMDSCEQLQALHDNVRERLIAHVPELNPDIMAGVDDALRDANMYVTNIFEACNFQDITGQRIMKIVATMKEVERQVLRMIVIFGLHMRADQMDAETMEELQTDAALLNGPQLPGNSLEQDDIDDILAKLL